MSHFVVIDGIDLAGVYDTLNDARGAAERLLTRRPAGWIERSADRWCFSDGMSYIHVYRIRCDNPPTAPPPPPAAVPPDAPES